VILIDHLKEIYIDAELEPVDHHRLVSQNHAQGLHRRPRGQRKRPSTIRTSSSTRILPSSAERNYGALLQPRARPPDRPAIRSNPTREGAGNLLWEVERRLAEDNVRPVIFHPRAAIYRRHGAGQGR